MCNDRDSEIRIGIKHSFWDSCSMRQQLFQLQRARETHTRQIKPQHAEECCYERWLLRSAVEDVTGQPSAEDVTGQP